MRLVLLAGILVVALPPGVAPAASCPNAVLRAGYSASLPDCRAYEQVSPADKNGGDISLDATADAEMSGSVVAYASDAAFAGAPTNETVNEYLGRRGDDSWATTPVSPPAQPSTNTGISGVLGFSADLTEQLVDTNAALSSDAVAGNSNFYLRDSAGAYQLIATQPSGFGGWFPKFDFGAGDFSHVLFDTPNQLDSTPPAPSSSSDNVYDFTGGQLKLIGVLPGAAGVDPNGAQAGKGEDPLYFHPVSDDDSRVYWTEPFNLNSPIYLRQGDTTTTAITVSQATGASSTPQSGYFWAATPDGSDAYFTSTSRLTDDTSINYGGNGDLYQYDVASGKLTDISVDPNVTDSQGASVQGVLGVGSSPSGGTYVYFTASGVLPTGASSRGETPSAGHLNLYVWHDDGSTAVTRFIGTLNGFDQAGGTFGNSNGEVEDVSPDGRYLAFLSQAPLTGYDNSDVSTGSLDNEAFLYDAQTDTLSCPSCAPNGAPPTGSASLHPFASFGFSHTTTRNVLDNGRLFFDSADQLVPQDTNQAVDVYEFEPDGVGSCGQAQGCLYLVSSGRSGDPSYFEDTSANGEDVFFLTSQPLVDQDNDELYDLYDARVDGGLASQNPPPRSAPCSGDACKGSSSAPPGTPTAASVTFFGPGNARAGAPPGRPSVLTHTVHGSTFFVAVKVPGPGRITIAGAGIRRVSRSAARAGTYRLRARLTAKASRALARRHRVVLRLRVTYAPPGARAASAAVRLRVLPVLRHRSRHARRARAASHDHGGAR